MNLALVYQSGIANVFSVDGATGRTTRLLQSDYHSCEMFAAGAIAAGAVCEVFHCDAAGDCQNTPWQEGPGELWRQSKRPPVPSTN